MNHNFAAVGIPILEGFAAAIHFTNISSPEMQRTTIERPTGTSSYFTASDVSIGFTFAGYLTDQFSFGFTGRYLDNTIADASAVGFAFDIGTKYVTGIQGLVLGFSLHGLTSDLTYSGNEFNRTMRLVPHSHQTPTDLALIALPHNIPLVFRANIATEI
jgi:hypothetical protein